jgi:hypothetical protein
MERKHKSLEKDGVQISGVEGKLPVRKKRTSNISAGNHNHLPKGVKLPPFSGDEVKLPSFSGDEDNPSSLLQGNPSSLLQGTNADPDANDADPDSGDPDTGVTRTQLDQLVDQLDNRNQNVDENDDLEEDPEDATPNVNGCSLVTDATPKCTGIELTDLAAMVRCSSDNMKLGLHGKCGYVKYAGPKSNIQNCYFQIKGSDGSDVTGANGVIDKCKPDKTNLGKVCVPPDGDPIAPCDSDIDSNLDQDAIDAYEDEDDQEQDTDPIEDTTTTEDVRSDEQSDVIDAS